MKRLGLAIGLALTIAAPVAAQLGQSLSYRFLQAVRDAKGDEVTKMLSEPGASIVNTKDFGSGETALHIVAKRGDVTYTAFLLKKGANPNLRDNKGNTPLLIATTLGQEDIVHLLILGQANVNLANDQGETPLIRAVQLRNLALVRELLTAGANPDQVDTLAGLSARDYAHQDARSPLIAKLIDDAPKRDNRQVAGPKF